MKRSNKKGFTIVELVIVIAVIAILAAVLIPTFAGIIRKANISNDTAVAKNMNTALAAYAADGEEAEDFAEVLQILRDSGFIVSNINPTTDGFYYVWEKESNQILLVDGENNYEVKYQSKELKAENKTPGATWHFAVSDYTKVDTIKALNANVVYSPKTKTDLLNAFEDTAATGGTIAISSDIILSENDNPLLGSDAGNETLKLDLLGNTLTNAGTYEFNYKEESTAKIAGQLTASSGTLDITNGYLTSEGAAKYIVAALFSGNVSVSDVVIESSTDNSAALRVLGTGNMNVKDTVVTIDPSVNGCAAEIGEGTATFENVTVTVDSTATGEEWRRVCVASSKGGTLTINGGTYTAGGTARGVLGTFTSAANYVINSGTFKAEDGAAIFSVMDIDATNGSLYGYTHTFEINGGTFIKDDTTYNFSGLTADTVKALFEAYSYPSTVTFANQITVAKTATGWLVTVQSSNTPSGT